MPIYEYECPRCKFRQDRLVISFFGVLRPVCMDCHIKMVRIMSKNTFHLKGDGWTPKYGKVGVSK